MGLILLTLILSWINVVNCVMTCTDIIIDLLSDLCDMLMKYLLYTYLLFYNWTTSLKLLIVYLIPWKSYLFLSVFTLWEYLTFILFYDEKTNFVLQWVSDADSLSAGLLPFWLADFWHSYLQDGIAFCFTTVMTPYIYISNTSISKK